MNAPRAPTDLLRLESIKILAKLELIVEFRPWIITNIYRKEPAYKVLFDCFSLGAPLGVLLDLLGSAPTPSFLNVDVEDFDFGLSLAERERFVHNFIQRVQILEIQGKLSYGEVLRVEDVLNGTNSGFMKVLKTVNRILAALEDCYPGLFVAPQDADLRKFAAIEELIESERIHVEFLRMVIDNAAFLSCESQAIETALASIVINDQRLRQYHDRVLSSLQQIEPKHLSYNIENWETIFAFDDNSVRNNMASTYRSLCTSYVSLYEYFDQIIGMLEPVLAAHAQMLLDILSYIPTRIADYCKQLQNILSLTLPTSPTDLSVKTHQTHYDSLCRTILRMSDISSGIDEMSWELRTLRAVKILKGRAFHWRSPASPIPGTIIDPSELGMLIFDDQLVVQDTAASDPVVFQIFLFDTMLLCCLDETRSRNENRIEDDTGSLRYPIRAWDLGPALRSSAPLNLVYTIPTKEMRKLRLLDPDSFELEWGDADRMSMLFTCPSGEDQHYQWCSSLERFVPSFIDERYELYEPFDLGEGTAIQVGVELNRDEDRTDAQSIILPEDSPEFAKLNFDPNSGGRRHSHPRPWSLIARKGAHSESSSLHQQLLDERGGEWEDILSPNMLPALFTGAGGKGSIPPLSPISLGGGDTGGFPHMLMPPTPPPDGDLVNEIDASEQVMDFTGQVTLLGGCAVAGGGYSDVWMAILNSSKDGRGQELKVAVKVIRSHYGSSESGNNLKKRIARELDVWKRLKHPNILPLYGTASGFGPFQSLICPWMEHGNVSRYMQKWGDVLSMTDRLQLLCEVAEGLRYLHSHEIVHGDLTGSNILIDDDRHACLGDFGLSNIVSDAQGAFSNHSTIGGAIRWADATLFMAQAPQSESEDQEQAFPLPTKKSDIYSFGSVTLEILSGRVPYHYIPGDAQVIFELAQGRKPRRPASSFVTDAQWEFIQNCWHDDPVLRPDADEVVRTLQVLLHSSLEFRRHTGSVWDTGPPSRIEKLVLPDHDVNASRRHSEPLGNG
ncbi:hypothetical protein GYMLUDRAFT_46128 [Collybiopsis luxurians FD-317 M1]|uniref:Uncharacterized protein n=1 Tax=Collybiopsis luxurians FD-317 M1 TaxID=944289 RepID=A0A0D0CH72_9AGAR|nr:hypothetical protein GYMLUDRAFT_46128 [Collybiopsis luxurians FD-317 M1]